MLILIVIIIPFIANDNNIDNKNSFKFFFLYKTNNFKIKYQSIFIKPLITMYQVCLINLEDKKK